uniref:GCR477 n=1 Tax=Schmidtea mediterranea TaxID=79327 RepID=A0A193KUH2_SCHMD|nr:GCR477 [Schmidtea mediterranea]
MIIELNILFTIVYCIIFILAVVGNVMVITVISYFMTVSVTNIFLINLCLSDLILAITNIPVNIVNDNWSETWVFGSFLCRMIPFIQGTGVSLIAFTQVILSTDRFVVVFYPLKVRISKKFAIAIISCVWFIALCSSSPLIFTSKLIENDTICKETWSPIKNQIYTISLLIFQYFIPVGCMIIFYSCIVYKMWFRHVPGIYSQQQCIQRIKSKEKLLKMVITISFLYTLSQLPRHIIYLCSITNESSNLFWQNKRILWICVILLSASSSCYNPIIYFWMNTTYRKLLRRIFRLRGLRYVNTVNRFDISQYRSDANMSFSRKDLKRVYKIK